MELHAAPREGTASELHAMQRGSALGGAINSYAYSVSVPKSRAASDYTPRIVPALAGASVPIEANQILWCR